MKTILKGMVAAAVATIATQAAAQIIFYERPDFGGRSFKAEGPVGNFERFGFNDRASSVIVLRERWEACEDARFGGRCVVLRPGRYPSLAAMGMNNTVSSVRPVARTVRVEEPRYAPPPPVPVYDNERRRGEKLFEAQVTSVRAVVGPPEQRCWVEREQVVQDRSDPNVGGAIIGGILGGVLGHQVGGGRGKDVATVGGALAGGAIGANVGREGGQTVQTRDVQRCKDVPSQARPTHWDVTYVFRGVEHRIQTTAPPGPTVTVNSRGEPRA